MTSATTLFFCAATSRCLSVETTYKPSKLSLILLKLPLDSARLCNVEQVVAQVIVDFPILFDIFIAIGDVWEIFAHTACILSMLLRALARVCTSEKKRKKEKKRCDEQKERVIFFAERGQDLIPSTRLQAFVARHLPEPCNP